MPYYGHPCASVPLRLHAAWWVCVACMPDFAPRCGICAQPAPIVDRQAGFVGHAYGKYCPGCVARVKAAGFTFVTRAEAPATLTVADDMAYVPDQKTSIAYVMGPDDVKVELRYTERLLALDGSLEWVFPTVVGPRYARAASAETGATTIPQSPVITNPTVADEPVFTLSVDVVSALPLGEIECATHRVSTVREPNRARVELDANEPGVVVPLEPGRPVLHHVQVAVRPELHVDRVGELRAGEESLHRGKVAGGVHRHRHDPATHPVVGEELALVPGGELARRGGEVLAIEDRPGHGRASPVSHQRKVRTWSVRIPDERLLCRRERGLR